MPEKDELDRLLDSALATYADPGVDSGLEQRVLAALAVERAAKEGKGAGWSRRWLAWAIAIPVAASLLVWVGVEKPKHGPGFQNESARGSDRAQTAPISVPMTEVNPSKTARSSEAKAPVHSSMHTVRVKPCPVTELLPPGTAAQGPCREAGRTVAAAPAAGNTPPFPKLDVFPTPQPLSPQERALAVVAMQSPAPLRKALVEAQNQDGAPIRIAAIHIPPIEPLSETQP